MKRGIVAGAVILFLAVLGIVISFALRSPPPYTVIIKDPSIKRVACTVTHGSTHTFYYRGRWRWEWDELCRRLGFGDHTGPILAERASASSQRQVSWTRQPSDTFWLILTHENNLTQPREFQCHVVDAQGHGFIYNTSGGVCDLKRSVTLSHWPLLGGMETQHGSTMHIKDTRRGVELVTIQIK